MFKSVGQNHCLMEKLFYLNPLVRTVFEPGKKEESCFR